MDNNKNKKIKINTKTTNNENDEKEKENLYQEILNKLNESENNYKDNDIIKKEEKNFSQQVDFLYHKDNPEGQSSIKNILIKQYKKKKKLQNENINNIKRKNLKSYSPKKKIIPYSNKNKGLFDPYLSQKELDYESIIEKQRAERQKKIDEYEKNNRQKKLKKEINQKILNFEKPKINSDKIKKNFVKKNEKNIKKEELITHFIQVPKPKIKKDLANNFGFFPKKYDMIINSLINEINQGKKENLIFRQKMKNYGKKNIDRYNNYYEFIYKDQKNNVQNNKNNININKNNKITKPTRAEIIKGLMQKYFGKENPKINKSNEINKNHNEINIINKQDKPLKNNQNEIIKDNNNKIFDIFSNKDNEGINFDNIDKLLSSEKLNFQDKINIISELNKNIDKYTKAMPIIINQVQHSLDKIYNNKADINFRKEINKVPYIEMASKIAYQIIQTNMDFIIEEIINELILDLTLDFNEINQRKLYLIKKQELVEEFDLMKNNLDDIIGEEKNILENNIKFIEDKKNDIVNLNNNIKENKIVVKKYKAYLDEDFIKRNDEYKNEFREYMVFKGSFYAENIFDIYDEFIEEEANSLLDKMVNQFFEKLNLN